MPNGIEPLEIGGERVHNGVRAMRLNLSWNEVLEMVPHMGPLMWLYLAWWLGEMSIKYRRLVVALSYFHKASLYLFKHIVKFISCLVVQIKGNEH